MKRTVTVFIKKVPMPTISHRKKMKLYKIENEKKRRKQEREKLKIKAKFLEGHVPRNPNSNLSPYC